MSLWRPESSRSRGALAVGMGRRGYAWRVGSHAPVQRATELEGMQQALADMSTGSSVRVIVAHDVAVHWLQEPPVAFESLAELRLVAAARCAQLHGGVPQDWWVAADWDARRPFVCAALPRLRTAPLEQSFARAGLRSDWQTAFGLACTRGAEQFPSEGWSALRSPERVLLWHCRAGRIICMATLAVRPQATPRDVEQHAARQVRIEALRCATVAEGPIHWMRLRGEDEPEAALECAALQGAAP